MMIGARTLFWNLPGTGIVNPLLNATKDSSKFIHLSNNKSLTVSVICTSFSLSSQLEWTQLDPDTGFVFFYLSSFVSEESM